MSESLSRVVQFSRTFSDAFVLDDLAQVGDFAKQAVLDKDNVATLSEDLAYAASKAVSDTLAMQEAHAIALSRALQESFGASDSLTNSSGLSKDDSFTIGDAVSITFIAGRGESVINENVFNAFAFNE
jgi:hypothetical protein